MDWKTLISTAVGILLGAFAREIGIFLQTSREEKCILNGVLFHQLNIWWELWRSDLRFMFSLFKEEFVEELRRRGESPGQIAEQFEHFKPQILNLLREANPASPQKLFDDYREAVKGLADVAPVLAHRINLTFVENFDEKIKDLIERSRQLDEAAGSPEGGEIVDRLFTNLTDDATRELIVRLERDLLHVAWLAGWRVWLDARRQIKDVPGYMRENVHEIVRQMLAHLENLLAEHHAGFGSQRPPDGGTA
ncbi:MAG: hypothetical protein M3362_10800 [Acidobacteriota bacterium]|nr:hypothetical protein [Acidobacteriota bacterium]